MTLPEAPLLSEILHSNVLNVVLAIIVLTWLAFKFKLGNALVHKQSELAHQVTSIEQQKRDAQQDLQQLKQRSESLHREIDTILMEARHTADAMAQQIIAHAEEDAKRLSQQARKQAEQDEHFARETLQTRFMEAILSDVEDKLSSQALDLFYTNAQHQQVDMFINTLPKLAHCLQGGM